MSSVNSRAKAQAEQGIIARFALPQAPQPNTTPSSEGVPEPSSLFESISISAWIAYLVDLATVVQNIRAYNIGPGQQWCLLQVIKKGDGVTTARFSDIGNAISGLYNDSNDVSLAVITMPYKKNLTIETAIRTPSPLITPQTQVVSVEAVDFSSLITGNTGDKLIDALVGIGGAAEGLQNNPATNAMLSAVLQSWQMFNDIQILQWSQRGQFSGALAGALASPQVGSAGQADIPTAKKGTAALWLLAAGLALSPIAPAALIPAGIALSKMRK